MKIRTAFGYFAKETNEAWFSFSLLLLRVTLGVSFLLTGLSKFSDWSAEGYLLSATGPFAEFFQGLAGSVIIDQLNIWGLTFIGLALIFGVFVRPASFLGIIMMVLYYLAHFEQNVEHGVIEYHIIYALIFVFFMSGGVGHLFGLDGLILRNIKKQKSWWCRVFFG